MRYNPLGRTGLGVAASLLLAYSSHAATAQQCAPQLAYDAIVAAVTDRFYDKTFRGLDWTARISHYRHAVHCDTQDAQVAATANELLSELHASHTAVYTRADVGYWGLNSYFSKGEGQYKIYFSGIWPERRDGKWHAKYVFEGSAAARAGISGGDELRQLNGKTFQPLAFGAGVSSVVISSDGESTRTVSLEPREESVVQAFVEASQASARIAPLGAYQVGYFHLWTARDPILQSLNSALSRFESQKVDALIIDLRGGYGGTSPDYLSKIRDSSYLAGIPKVFLIDDGVRSGKELLAALIKRDAIGTLVGSRTAGAFLGAVPVRLIEDRYFLLVAAYGSIPMPGIGPIEGIGVTPDVEVAPCRARCRGRDPQLDRAMELIGSKLNALVYEPSQPCGRQFGARAQLRSNISNAQCSR